MNGLVNSFEEVFEAVKEYCTKDGKVGDNYHQIVTNNGATTNNVAYYATFAEAVAAKWSRSGRPTSRGPVANHGGAGDSNGTRQ